MSTAENPRPSASELVFDVLKTLMTAYHLWGSASQLDLSDLCRTLGTTDARLGDAVEYLVREGLITLNGPHNTVQLTRRGAAWLLSHPTHSA